MNPQQSPVFASFSDEFRWAQLTRDGTVSSKPQLDGQWFANPDTLLLCLHRRDQPYFDATTLQLLQSSIGHDPVFYFLIPREPPPTHGVAYCPPVFSFACSVRVYLTLVSQVPENIASRGVYGLAYAMLTGKGELPTVRCLQIPTATASRLQMSQPHADVEWVVPHQGSLDYLDKCLQSVAKTAAAADRVAVAFDETLSPEHRALMRRYPSHRFFAAAPCDNGPYVGRDRLGRGSEADILMHQDSDDIACADRRQVLLAAMLERNLELIGSHELRVDEMQRLIFPVRFPRDVVPEAFDQGYRHPLFHPTSAIRRDAFCRVGGFSTHRKFGNDTEFLFRAMFSLRIGNVDEFLYIRRKRENSLSTAPETALGSPVRKQLTQMWFEDFGRVRRGELALEQASFRLQHREDYDRIRLELVGPDGGTAAKQSA